MVEYVTCLEHGIPQLGARKVKLLSRGNLNPRMMTVDARSIHKCIWGMKVEDFRGKFPSLCSTRFAFALICVWENYLETSSGLGRNGKIDVFGGGKIFEKVFSVGNQ